MWNILTVPSVWYLTVPNNMEYLTVPRVWYFNCPRQCGMFLLFRECGILTVPDSMECSYCSYSVEF